MTDLGDPKETLRERGQRIAWVVIVVADVALLAWCAMAALIPQYLPGPHSASIVTDGYEGYTGDSWSALATESPRTADYIVLVFRMFGIYGATFGLLAVAIAATAFRRGERWAWWALLVGNTIGYGAPMTYDWIVDAMGPFEMLEYVGIGLVYAALAVTAPFLRGGRAPRRGGAPRRDSSRPAWSSGGARAS